MGHTEKKWLGNVVLSGRMVGVLGSPPRSPASSFTLAPIVWWRGCLWAFLNILESWVLILLPVVLKLFVNARGPGILIPQPSNESNWRCVGDSSLVSCSSARTPWSELPGGAKGIAAVPSAGAQRPGCGDVQDEHPKWSVELFKESDLLETLVSKVKVKTFLFKEFEGPKKWCLYSQLYEYKRFGSIWVVSGPWGLF